jgi:hypothetical protein
MLMLMLHDRRKMSFGRCVDSLFILTFFASERNVVKPLPQCVHLAKNARTQTVLNFVNVM